MAEQKAHHILHEPQQPANVATTGRRAVQRITIQQEKQKAYYREEACDRQAALLDTQKEEVPERSGYGAKTTPGKAPDDASSAVGKAQLSTGKATYDADNDMLYMPDSTPLPHDGTDSDDDVNSFIKSQQSRSQGSMLLKEQMNAISLCLSKALNFDHFYRTMQSPSPPQNPPSWWTQVAPVIPFSSISSNLGYLHSATYREETMDCQ